MKNAIHMRIARCLAVLAIALQVFLPASLAVADASGMDVSGYICAPSGEISPESRAAAERLAKLLGEEFPSDPSPDGHCPLCTFVHSALMPKPATLTAPAVYAHEQVFVRYEPGLVRKPQGPPLGSRGPPAHI